MSAGHDPSACGGRCPHHAGGPARRGEVAPTPADPIPPDVAREAARRWLPELRSTLTATGGPRP